MPWVAKIMDKTFDFDVIHRIFESLNLKRKTWDLNIRGKALLLLLLLLLSPPVSHCGKANFFEVSCSDNVAR